MGPLADLVASSLVHLSDSGRASGSLSVDYVCDAPAVPRDQGRNHTAISAVVASFALCNDITPIAMRPIVEGHFDISRDYGINPAPLFNQNPPALTRHLFVSTFGVDIAELSPAPGDFISQLREIETFQLLGAYTANKMSFVKDIAGTALRSITGKHLNENKVSYYKLITHTIDLLIRQIGRLSVECAEFATEADMLKKVRRHRLMLDLKRLFTDYPYLREHPAYYYVLFSDVVSESILRWLQPEEKLKIAEEFRVVRNYGIEMSFSPRDMSFLFLGDEYGDCTANRIRSQVDSRVANIHWTVYPWILDPYYRVLEALLDGKRALKCHLLPLVIHDRPVLMVDAIEAVPELRERKDGEPNPDLDTKLTFRRIEILEELLGFCKNLATKMGLEAVYVEKFSNARWIRDHIEKLPSDGYHVSEVEKPYETNIIQHNVQTLTGKSAGEIAEEVQAINTGLMYQQVRRGYKEVGVLIGRRENWRLPISGP